MVSERQCGPGAENVCPPPTAEHCSIHQPTFYKQDKICHKNYHSFRENFTFSLITIKAVQQ